VPGFPSFLQRKEERRKGRRIEREGWRESDLASNIIEQRPRWEQQYGTRVTAAGSRVDHSTAWHAGAERRRARKNRTSSSTASGRIGRGVGVGRGAGAGVRDKRKLGLVHRIASFVSCFFRLFLLVCLVLLLPFA